jgi:ankyrin repeat protein
MEDSGLTALHVATKNGHLACAQLLLSAGADLELPTRYGETPLFLAARKGHLEFLELFYKMGVDINARNHGKNTALMVICKQAHKFQPDLKHGHHGNGVHVPENKALALEIEAEARSAQYKRLIKFGKQLIKYGADVHVANAKGETALLVAAMYGELDLVKALAKPEITTCKWLSFCWNVGHS